MSLFIFLVAQTLLSYAAGHPGCKRPSLNITVLQRVKQYGGCIVLNEVCADDGMLVVFDPKLGAENLTRASPYEHLIGQSGLWNFPSRGGTNTDALLGHQPNSFVPIRPASRMEPASHLRQPVFSPCTMPVIMTTDWVYNFHEVFAQLAGVADVFFRQQGMIDDLATLVLATPDGLALSSFHHALLSPYSRYPPITLDELSQRPPHREQQQQQRQGVAWSHDGSHVSCFERAVLCKIHGFAQPLVHTAQFLSKKLEPLLPVDPLGFGQSGPGDRAEAEGATLRVLFEAKNGPARNIKNLQQILHACDRANTQGFQAGPFRRLSCKVLDTGDSPSLHGLQRFYTTVGAVRSAHVLVAVHGAGAANSAFMRADNGSVALLEIRPCGFGTRFCGWPNAYMGSQLEQAQDSGIRFFALNLEDPAQCAPSDFAQRVGPEDMRARDQHVSPRPGTLLAMLRHVGALLRDPPACQRARDAKQLYGYAVPGGLVLGPQCVGNVTEFLQKGAPVIRD